MTNETATAAVGVTDRIYSEFGNQLSQGQELWDKVITWIAEKGLSFAISLIAAIVIFALGALAIRLIVSFIGKAVEKGGKKNTLFGNFVRNVTSKVC